MQGSVRKSQSFLTAVDCLWASWVVELVSVLLSLFNLTPASAPRHILTACLRLAFTAFIFSKISDGRNWARITFLVGFSLGCLLTLLLYYYALGHLFQMLGALSATLLGLQLLIVALGAVQLGLQFYALTVIFSKAWDDWFLIKKTKKEGSFSNKISPKSLSQEVSPLNYQTTLMNLLYRLEHDNTTSAVSAAERIAEIGIPGRALLEDLTRLMEKSDDETVYDAIQKALKQIEARASALDNDKNNSPKGTL